MSALLKIVHPGSELVILPMEVFHKGASAMDEQSPYIRVSSFADSQQLRFSACGVLLGNQSQPRGELSPLTEHSCVAYGCNQGCGAQGTDTGYANQSLAIVALPRRQLNLPGVLRDL